MNYTNNMLLDDKKKDKNVGCLMKYFYFRSMPYHLGPVG